MSGIIFFGIGSTLLVDFEESAGRAGLTVIAGVRNHPGENHLSEGIPSLAPENLTGEIRAVPYLVPLFTPGHRFAAARQAALTTPFRLIDPSVAAPRRITLGPGCYVNVGCSIGACSVFGAFVLINRGASIGHHARLGDFVSVGPGVTIAGHVTVGRGGMIGAGAVVLPNVTIGENAVVAAGSVVTRDVEAACLVAGNPARVIRRDVGGYKGMSV